VIFSENIKQFLGRIYRHEVHNSVAYSQISNFLDVEGYKNLAKYYADWSSHETEHSVKVREFCNTNNINIDMSIAIEGLDINLKNMPITHFVIITVDTENETTDLYSELLEMGKNEKNTFTERFALDFILEQIEETEKALGIFDSVNNIGANKGMLQLFDNTFGD